MTLVKSLYRSDSYRLWIILTFMGRPSYGQQKHLHLQHHADDTSSVALSQLYRLGRVAAALDRDVEEVIGEVQEYCWTPRRSVTVSMPMRPWRKLSRGRKMRKQRQWR